MPNYHFKTPRKNSTGCILLALSQTEEILLLCKKVPKGHAARTVPYNCDARAVEVKKKILFTTVLSIRKRHDKKKTTQLNTFKINKAPCSIKAKAGSRK